jgi:hypothetical protein
MEADMGLSAADPKRAVRGAVVPGLTQMHRYTDDFPSLYIFSLYPLLHILSLYNKHYRHIG